LDSRLKINRISAQAAGATFVRGYFDPLLAEHAKRLVALPRPIVVIVADPPEPLLPLAARQLLVAALACVDGVLAPDAQVPPDAAMHDWCAGDLIIREGFIRHVRERSQA
jgi:hypothetical protein